MSRSARHRRPSRRNWLASVVAGVVTGVLVGGLSVVSGISFGTPAQAETSSEMTVAANQQDTDIDNAPMPDLAVTVSKTRDLQAEGVKISWTGGIQSEAPTGGNAGSNFLQIMQCWGTDASGGPDRTTCQYGGFVSSGAQRDALVNYRNPIPAQDAPYTIPGTATNSPTYTGIPFFGADGGSVEKVVLNEITGQNVLADAKKPDNEKIDLNNNQYFTQYTTNEISWAGSGADGTGSVKFEMQTVVQSPGLGCGTSTVKSGKTPGLSCWLVVIPRGAKDANEESIRNSGLFWDSWKHRIAIKLDFLPADSRCKIGGTERQLAGSELPSVAIASWQPTLCSAKGGSAYTAIIAAESDALQSANSGTATKPMALTSRALSTPDVKDSLTYAPIALTGVSIGFSIDREVNQFADIPDDIEDEVKGQERLAYDSMNLTPRLLAKLLTYSYTDSLPGSANKSHLKNNPRSITFDPDFLAVNQDSDWQYQSIASPALADLIVPQGRSDSARAVWDYILADADAVAFLNGADDGYGMKVNPWTSPDASVFQTVGTGDNMITYPRDNFPKGDPTEQATDSTGKGPVNVVTWRPYTSDFASSARLILRGDGQILGAWDAVSVPPKYGKTSRNLPGFQRVAGITDTGSAAKYQVFQAKLLNPAGEFVGPDDESLAAAAAAMTADPAQPQVYRFDQTSQAAKGAPDAYPLAMPVYAATNPAMTDSAVRADYANFINYAATSGQEQGTAIGQLPAGYAPIPSGWQDQAIAAAAKIAAGPVKAPTTTSAPAAAAPAAPAAAAPAAAAPAAAAGAAPAAVPADPGATGTSTGPLLGAATKADAEIGAISAAVPLAIVAGLLAALAVPVITRIRRRL